jgi:hypothetical protein
MVRNLEGTADLLLMDFEGITILHIELHIDEGLLA